MRCRPSSHLRARPNSAGWLSCQFRAPTSYEFEPEPHVEGHPFGTPTAAFSGLLLDPRPPFIIWAGSSEKMANGGVRVTNSARGLWDGGAAWRLTPDLVIGTTDGAEETTFAAISGLEVGADGRIYVLDRQVNQLRIFTPDGSHLKSVGRPGNGPGEFRAANGLRWIAPDSLLVVDQRGNRYTILTREGTFARSVVRTLGFYGWAFAGGYEAGKIYERSAVRKQRDLRPILLGTSLREANGAVTVASRDSAANLQQSADTVYLANPPGPYFESFSIQTARGGMVIGVPFTPAPHYYLDGKGGIWHGHGNVFRIAHSTFAGDTLMEIALSGAPAPVLPEEIEEWKSNPAATRFTEMGGSLDDGRIPKAKPFFDDLYVDADGYLWVSLPAGPKEIAFAVVDSNGHYLGRLQEPVPGRSGCPSKSCLYVLRQFYGSEILFREEVILARLIDHPKLLVLLSLAVRKQLVNLTNLKRSRVAIISNTDNESLHPGFGHDH